MEKETTAIIIGAGTSGLAAAACLNRLGIPNTILEREDCFASIWQKKSYDRLHLHLPKRVCELPRFPFPKSYPNFVPKDLFIRYLTEYVSRLDINPLYNRSVEHAEFDPGLRRWRVRVRNSVAGEVEDFLCGFLVVATGYSCDAFIPEVEGLDGFEGDEVIHSTAFKSGKPYSGKRVLVVGSGNSGMEIALDLANHCAKTSMVVRSPTHILPLEMMNWTGFLMKYLSMETMEWLMVILSRLWFGDLTKYGITRPEMGPFTMMKKYNKYPVIDLGTCREIKSGRIQTLPALKMIRGREAVFENGESHPFDVIIFATGFKRSTKTWLKEEGGKRLLKDNGLADTSNPNHWKGENGLYCVGLAGRGFFGAALESESVAEDIKKNL